MKRFLRAAILASAVLGLGALVVGCIVVTPRVIAPAGHAFVVHSHAHGPSCGHYRVYHAGSWAYYNAGRWEYYHPSTRRWVYYHRPPAVLVGHTKAARAYRVPGYTKGSPKVYTKPTPGYTKPGYRPAPSAHKVPAKTTPVYKPAPSARKVPPTHGSYPSKAAGTKTTTKKKVVKKSPGKTSVKTKTKTKGTAVKVAPRGK